MKIKSSEYLRAVRAMRVDQVARHAMMMTVWEASSKQMMVDPHTANAIVAAERFRDRRGVPMTAYETAKPFKFPGTIQYVLGVQAVVSDRFTHVVSDTQEKAVPAFNDEAKVSEYLINQGVRQK